MKGRRRLGRFGWASGSALSAAVVLLAAPREARAEQFVLFDATFPYTWDNAINSTPSKSHYYVNEGNWLNKARPANWTSPVNYRDGTVHIRVEVIEKPAGGQMVGWALCYVGNAGSYGCPYTPYYTQLGVYERDVGMHSFFNSETINWAQGVKQVDLVYTVNDSGSGHISNFPDLKDLTTPTKVRITMIQVSQGAKYDPTLLPGADGGVPEGGPPRDGGPVIEAGAPDARGDTGTAGAGGTGGASTGGTGGQGTGGSGPGTGGSAGVATVGTGGQGQGGSSSTTMGTGAGGASAGMAGSRGKGDVESGCNCSTASDGHGSIGYAWLALLSVSWIGRRRRRSRASDCAN